jgi:putative transposase
MTIWPHAPPHMLQQGGVYMVTAGTYLKNHFFKSEDRLHLLHDSLLSFASNNGWILHAWAVFSNHYHFLAQSPDSASNLSSWIAQLHQQTASAVNELDSQQNRQVWYQFWDSRIDKHPSYMARLNYIHCNAVKHGLVVKPSDYRWCSASQFELKANHSFVKSVYSFDFTKVKVFDEY